MKLRKLCIACKPLRWTNYIKQRRDKKMYIQMKEKDNMSRSTSFSIFLNDNI